MAHLLALVTDAFGGHGGIARYNSDFLTALAASDVVDRVTVLPRLAPKSIGKLPTKVDQRLAVFNPAHYALGACQAIARKPKIDVLFCGHLHMSHLAAALASMLRVPLWLQVHGIDAWTLPSKAVQWGAERASLVTAVSRYTKARMVKWWNGEPSRIHVLPNTVGADFYPAPKPIALEQRYGVKGKQVILTLSRLTSSDRYKGHDKVLAALPEICRRIPDIVYLIVGDGDDVARLRSVAETSGVSDRVVFAGHVPESELPDHFRVADVYVMPSTKEGFGIVFLEAAASGVPVIGGNRDGSLDALADGAIGTLIDPYDSEALTNAIVSTLEGNVSRDPEAVRRFAFDNFARRVDDLVRTLAR
jgi:phosphatidylinositol alpha-1,6-mannosyltransferase